MSGVPAGTDGVSPTGCTVMSWRGYFPNGDKVNEGKKRFALCTTPTLFLDIAMPMFIRIMADPTLPSLPSFSAIVPSFG